MTIKIFILSVILFFGINILVFKNKSTILNINNNSSNTASTFLPTVTEENNSSTIIEKKPTGELIPTKEIKKIIPTPTEVWGVAKQIGEHTWTMKIGEDSTMATANEILSALNEYRKVHGSQIVMMNDKLQKYAQERAIYLNSIKSVDQHKGFTDYMENQDGFNKLGFTALGENISYGYKLNGVHIIEWMYAGDEAHDKNQLDNRWNYVGIGVNGLATCLIFGTGKF